MWDSFTIRRKMNSFAWHRGWTRAPAMPVNAWVIATSRCNLKCRTCPAHSPDFNFPETCFEDMRPEVFERVKRELLPGLKNIYLSGAGEPFLAPVTYEMLDRIIHPKRHILIVTNGTIIRPDYLERLIRVPSRIRVSLDGATPEVVKHIRGVSLDRVREFMKTVQEIRRRAGHPEFELQLNCVITRSNLEQLTDVVELAHGYGADMVSFTNFEPYGRADDFCTRESLMTDPETVLPRWRRARQRATELGIVMPELYFDCPGRPEEERREYQPTVYDETGRMRQCAIPWWSLYVETHGAVKPCCIWPDDAAVGNILEHPLRTIWNGPAYRALRRTVNTPNMPEHCKRCFVPSRI